MKFENKTDGPKAVNTTDRGAVVIQPGASADLDVSEEEQAAMKRLGFLDPSTAEKRQETPANPQEVSGMLALTDEQRADAEKLKDDNTAAELAKIAEDEEVNVEGLNTKADVAAAIIAKRNA